MLAAWSYKDIRRADSLENILRLANPANPGLARLEIAEPAARAVIRSFCPDLENSETDGKTGTARIIVWSFTAGASILGVVLFGLPILACQLAQIMPPGFEKRIGGAADSQVRFIYGGKRCISPRGVASLSKLAGELQSVAGLPLAIDPAVVSFAVPNAFALPGAKVYVLSGLIAKAQSPDELAGVLAHEIGHVAHRDGLRKLIHDSSTGFLVGLLFGDVTGSAALAGLGHGVINAAYSQSAEANADAYASMLMGKLGRSAKPMGELLLRLTGADKSNPLSIFASHPLTSDRVIMLEKESYFLTGEPLLSAEEWNDLKTICK